MTQVPI